MQFDRNRYFILGLLLLALGLELRMIDSFVLNEPTTRAVYRIAKKTQLAATDYATQIYMQTAPSPKKKVYPPRWLGMVMLSVGTVICIHSFILPKGGG